MALKLEFREVTPEDTEILRMIALRNGKAEDYLCCDVTNEDGVTQTTWYSKADVALWGEDYIRAHTTMKYSDYSGWIIILDMEPWNDAQASPRKKKKRDSFPQIPTWLEGHVKERKQKRLPTVEDDELLAALWVAGCHQSGGLASIYDIGLGLSLHCEQFSVIPHFQQFISGRGAEGHGGQALLFSFFDMALQPGRDLGKGIPFLLFSW